MNRDELISQVKEEYASIASSDSQQHFNQSTNEITPEAYYERLLGMVISEIERGTFDSCRSGSEVINRVAADKSILNDWNH